MLASMRESAPRAWLRAALVCLAALAASCSSGGGPGDERAEGSVRMGLATPPDAAIDVMGVLFEVESVDTGIVQSKQVPLEEEGLPAEISVELEGHRFADWFVVLNPGDYLVRATPLNADGSPSDKCRVAEGAATVFPSQTTELLLVSPCGDSSGGLDVAVVFNTRPFIEELEFRDSKFICRDEAAQMVATASDPDGDAITFEWSVVSGPDGATDEDYCLIFDGARAAFSAAVIGRYELLIVVSDGDLEGRLVFPVYVSRCGPVPECPGDAIGDDPSAPPGTAVGNCECGDLSIDPNWEFDPETEYPEDPPEGPPEFVPTCEPGLTPIVDEMVDANNDGFPDIVEIVPAVANPPECVEDVEFCTENNGVFVEVGGPVLDPAIPIPVAALTDGCDGAPAPVVCPILSEGEQAMNCDELPPEMDCMTALLCPEEGAWADPADPTVRQIFEAQDQANPASSLTVAMDEQLRAADLLLIPPCQWEALTETMFDVTIMAEPAEDGANDGEACDEDADCKSRDCMGNVCQVFENPYFVEIDKGSSKWNVMVAAGITGGGAKTTGIFHPSMQFDLKTETSADLRATVFGSERMILSMDSSNVTSQCGWSADYDAKIIGESVDVPGRIQIGDNILETDVGPINEQADGGDSAACQAALFALKAQEKTTNEALHDAIIAWAFYNLAGPVGTVINSEAAAQAFIDDYVDEVGDYQDRLSEFLAAQDSAITHTLLAELAETELQFQLSKPIRWNQPIGPFSVGIEANAVGKVGIVADVSNVADTGFDPVECRPPCEMNSDCASNVCTNGGCEPDGGVEASCFKAVSGSTIKPRASVGGYLFFYTGISLGNFAGVKAGIRGELDFANFQLPMVTEFGFNRGVQTVGAPEVPDELMMLLDEFTLLNAPSQAAFSVPYSYGANLKGMFLSGRLDLVARAWALFLSVEWKKTLVSWEGIQRSWEVAPPGGGDALESFQDGADLGSVPDMVTLFEMELGTPMGLPADPVNNQLQMLGLGHNEAQVGDPWITGPGERCQPAIP